MHAGGTISQCRKMFIRQWWITTPLTQYNIINYTGWLVDNYYNKFSDYHKKETIKYTENNNQIGQRDWKQNNFDTNHLSVRMGLNFASFHSI